MVNILLLERADPEILEREGVDMNDNLFMHKHIHTHTYTHTHTHMTIYAHFRAAMFLSSFSRVP